MTHPGGAILVFVRAPEPGRVKTRLAAEIGVEAALRVYTRLARHTLAEALALAPEVAVRVHFTPAAAAAAVRRWLGEGPTYLPQRAGGLGERLEQAFREAFTAGFARVVVVGSDLPHLSASLLHRALELLEEQEAVLGPARDGGYYLLGLRRDLPGLFEDISWSTDRVFSQTLARLQAAGIEPVLLETLSDVDIAADLSELPR